jgi:hypothetical protein
LKRPSVRTSQFSKTLASQRSLRVVAIVEQLEKIYQRNEEETRTVEMININLTEQGKPKLAACPHVLGNFELRARSVCGDQMTGISF